jgi:hypothetical protein
VRDRPKNQVNAVHERPRLVLGDVFRSQFTLPPSTAEFEALIRALDAVEYKSEAAKS